MCRCLVCSYEWNARPGDLKHGHGCPECAKIKISNSLKLTHDEHVAAINKVNPYVEVLGKIINNQTKVLCRCKVCSHEWSVKPNSLKNGYGCPVCGRIKNANARILTHAEQVMAIAKVNPDVEVLGKITKNKVKVPCRCKICGYEWSPTPDGLKHGGGCPKCAGNIKLTHAEHVAAIKKINPDVEVLGEIKNNSTKVLCKCKICGHKWDSTPNKLKCGYGCPRCAKYGFYSHDVGKLYIMVDNLEAPTIMKIGVSVDENKRSRKVLNSARRAGVSIPALHVAKTWEGPTDLMQRIEQMMHENYAEWNIRFPAKFDGCTEFFYYTPETAGVFDAVNEIYYTVVNQF